MSLPAHHIEPLVQWLLYLGPFAVVFGGGMYSLWLRMHGSGTPPVQNAAPVRHWEVSLGSEPDEPETAGPGDLRPHEFAVAAREPVDAGLVFIGTIRTPWGALEDCPDQGRANGPICRIEVDELWSDALDGIEAFDRIEIVYWLDAARRDLVHQAFAGDGVRGTFALRSAPRPNPIATSTVTLVAREGRVLSVQGLDCLDGTPLLDLKPDR